VSDAKKSEKTTIEDSSKCRKVLCIQSWEIEKRSRELADSDA
jgi:hypothetical protein